MTDTLNIKLPPTVIILPLSAISTTAQVRYETTHIRITEAGDTRITEAGDIRIVDAWDIAFYPEIEVVKLPNEILTIQLPE